MRKVILQEFISLDGLAAGPKDNVDLVPASTQGDKRFGQQQVKLMNSVDTILLGRVTDGRNVCGLLAKNYERKRKSFCG